MNRKFGRILALAALVAGTGTALITGTAFAAGTYSSESGGSSHYSRVSDLHGSSRCDDECDNNDRCNNECHSSGSSDCDSCDGGPTKVRGDYYGHYRGARAHEGGNGGRGGATSAKCVAPLGLSAGAVASSGGTVDQCNSDGGNGGEGGAGDVGINH